MILFHSSYDLGENDVLLVKIEARILNLRLEQQECKRMLIKGNIYKQMYEGQCVQKATIKVQNRRLIKFFITIYFLIIKIGAVRENFESVMPFSQKDIGNANISAHLKDCSSCTHTPQ